MPTARCCTRLARAPPPPGLPKQRRQRRPAPPCELRASSVRTAELHVSRCENGRPRPGGLLARSGL
eukprot:scaffold3507_cov48-Phaeocystis_antarctica.AAC.1